MPTRRLPTNFFRRILFAVEVRGLSAWPELIPGKRYFATGLKTPTTGDYIVFKSHDRNAALLVKKVVSQEGRTYLVHGIFPDRGENSETLRVHASEILGTLLRRRPPSLPKE